MASIRERASTRTGTTWQVLYRWGGKQSSHSFRDKKKAAQFRVLVDSLGPDRALAAIEDEVKWAGMLTVSELADRFLEKKAGDVTSRTMSDYRRDVDNYVRPWFGHKAAESLSEVDVQKWVDHMALTLAPKSVADRHMLLHSMYKFGSARSRRLVSHNPCLETELPKRTKKPVKGTTVPEWLAIRHAAQDGGSQDAADFIEFLGTLGWRFSEGAALLVDACEDDGTDVWVDVVRVFRMVDNRQVLLDGVAKSDAAFRRSRLPADAADLIRRRLVGKGPRDYVFTNTRGNHWNQNTFLRDTWPRLLETAGVGGPERKPTPHWLRHMAVANMARAGVPMHEIRRIIGHEKLETTDSTYGSMITTLNRESLTNLNLVLRGQALNGEVVLGEVV